MRLTYRNKDMPYNSAIDFGFRLAISSDEPAKTAPPPAQKEESDMMKKFEQQGFVDVYGIYFDTGKWKVKPESFRVIDQFTSFLKEHPDVKMIIEGRTQNRRVTIVKQK